MRDVEDELFARFGRTQDPELLGQVYDRVAPELLHVALHVTGRPQEAEDVLQATFLVALEKARTYDPSQPVRPWLLGILKKQAQQANARSRRTPDPERVHEPRREDPTADLEREELVQRLDEALLGLPQAYQSVLLLRLRHGLEPAEIARVLHRPPGTVRAQLSRGMERLREALPASLAGAALLALVPRVRGLHGVREAVVSHAASNLPWTAALGLPLASVSMQKLLTVGSAAIVFVVATLAVRSRLAPERSEDLARPAAGTVQLATPRELGDARAPGARELASTEDATAEAGQTGASPPAAEDADAMIVGALEVRVLDASWDRPVPNEWVLLEITSRERFFADRASARTNAQGVARFEGLPVGSLSAAALRGSQDAVVIAPGDTAQLDLALLPGFEVTGEVVDVDGHPVPGAEIWLSRRWTWRDGEVQTRADAAGRFRLTNVSRDHYVGARAEGWAPSFSRQFAADVGSEVSARLVLERRAGRLAGRVVDEGGRALAGAALVLGTDVDAAGRRLVDASMSVSPSAQRTRSAADGSFSFERAPLMGGELCVRLHGFASRTFRVAPDAGGALEVVLRPTARIVGRVVDEHGAPCHGAWIRPDPMGRFDEVRTWTDEQGRFRLENLPEGEVELVVEWKERGQARRRFLLESGQLARWDVTLAPFRGLRGRLSTEEGEPVQGWSVAVRSGGRTVGRSDPTGSDGRFRIALAEAGPFDVFVDEPGGWRAFPHLILRGLSAEEEHELVIPNATGGVVEAEVVRADGSPAAGAALLLWHDDERLWRNLAFDGDGRIRIERVPAGRLDLRIASEASPWKRLDSLEVRAGEVHDLGRIRLEAGRPVQGEFSGLSDERLQGLTASVADLEGIEAAGVELHGSRFSIGALAPGDYTLLVHGVGVCMQRHAFTVSATSAPFLSVPLTRAGVREAVLRLPEGSSPHLGVHARLEDANGEIAWMGGGMFLEPELRLAVSALPGSYTLIGATRSGRAFRAPFAILGFQDGGDPLEVAFLP